MRMCATETRKTLLFRSLVVLLLLSTHVLCQSDNDDEDWDGDEEEEEEVNLLDVPDFVSSAQQELEVWPGGSMSLTCQVNDLSQFQIMWKRSDNELLSVGEKKLTRDSRFELEKIAGNQGMVLRLNEIRADDAGKYECLIASQPPKAIHFNVRVKDGDANDEEGEALTGGADATACLNILPTVLLALASVMLTK